MCVLGRGSQGEGNPGGNGAGSLREMGKVCVCVLGRGGGIPKVAGNRRNPIGEKYTTLRVLIFCYRKRARGRGQQEWREPGLRR